MPSCLRSRRRRASPGCARALGLGLIKLPSREHVSADECRCGALEPMGPTKAPVRLVRSWAKVAAATLWLVTGWASITFNHMLAVQVFSQKRESFRVEL